MLKIVRFPKFKEIFLYRAPDFRYGKFGKLFSRAIGKSFHFEWNVRKITNKSELFAKHELANSLANMHSFNGSLFAYKYCGWNRKNTKIPCFLTHSFLISTQNWKSFTHLECVFTSSGSTSQYFFFEKYIPERTSQYIGVILLIHRPYCPWCTAIATVPALR